MSDTISLHAHTVWDTVYWSVTTSTVTDDGETHQRSLTGGRMDLHEWSGDRTDVAALLIRVAMAMNAPNGEKRAYTN